MHESGAGGGKGRGPGASRGFGVRGGGRGEVWASKSMRGWNGLDRIRGGVRGVFRVLRGPKSQNGRIGPDWAGIPGGLEGDVGGI